MGVVLLEVQHGALYTSGYGRSIEAGTGTKKGQKPLLAEKTAVRGAGLEHAVGVEHQCVAGGEISLLFGQVRAVEDADGAARSSDTLDAPVGLEQYGCRMASVSRYGS